jgi:hypothetical protein
MGGPLDLGDIEELDQYAFVVCPWHRYKIDLASGDGLSNDEAGLASRGPRHRVHDVTIENGKVMVKLGNLDGELPSDSYACMGLWKVGAWCVITEQMQNAPSRKPPAKVHSKMEN